MKQFVLASLIALGLYSNSFAEVRSTFEKIYASDYMPSTQTISFEVQSDKPIHLMSRLSGVRLQTENRRSIVSIESEDDLNDLPDPLIKRVRKALANKSLGHFYIFANFSHVSNLNPKTSEYYIGILPRTASVETVMLEKAFTASGAPAGVTLNLKLSEDLTIIPQESDLFPIMHLNRPTLSYTMERVGDEHSGATFDLLDALTGRYAYALSLSSLQSRQLNSSPAQLTKTQILKDLSTEQKEQVLLNCLKESHRIQEMGIYHFLYNNSIVHSSNIIRSALGQPGQIATGTDSAVINYYSLQNEFDFSGEPTGMGESSGQLFYRTIERVSKLLQTNDDLVAKVFSSPDNARSPSENFVSRSGAQKLIRFLQQNGFSAAEIENFRTNAAEFESQPL